MSKRPRGRPSSYTKAKADEICRRMSNGESLREICRDESMPAISTVLGWLAKNKDFSEQYAHAREMLLEVHAAEIVEIADDGVNDYVERQEKGGAKVVFDKDNVRRSQLRIDTRKWLLSKLLPKKYGDKVAVEQSGPDGGPIQTQAVVNVTISRRA